MSDNDEIAEFPEGWVSVFLDEIGGLFSGQSPTTNTVNGEGNGTPYVTGPEQWDGTNIHQNKWTTAPKRLVPNGCIFITVKGAGVGTLFPGIACAIGRDIYAYLPSGGVSREYIRFALQHTIDVVVRNAAGLIPGLTRHHLLGHAIPLPPLAEQKRIVAKVETLLARVNAARQRLAKVPALLKRFRRSVLAAACSGQLTEDWRETQAPEPAIDLIARVRQLSPIGGEFPADRWRQRKPSPLTSTELPDIPEEWTWIRLPDTGYMNRGRSRNRPRNAPHLYGGDFPFVQTGDIARSRGRITEHQQTYSDAGLAQSRLWPTGTICITIAANIADSAILTYPSCFPDSVVGIVTDPELCVAEYLEFFIRTARENLSQFAPATAQKNINIAILNDLAVPLAPIAEQHEIVRRVEALLARADRIEKRLATATRRVETLTQAILAQAFRGELVPTEAELARQEGRDYEPASVLLERIRKQKDGQEPTTRKANRAQRKSKRV